MNKKLISVLIPLYNVDQFVKKAVNSIQNQTYKNLEIIAIDDGSVDETYGIVEELAQNDNRIKLYRNETNQKIVKTLNRALSIASGEYIVRMDGDDISAPDRIEKLITFLEMNTEYDLVGSSLTAIDINDNEIGKSQRFSDYDLMVKLIKYDSPVSHIWAARKSLYDKLNGYRELSGVEDYDFLLRMTSSGYKYTNLEDYYGYFVRLGRGGNTISLMGVKQKKLHQYAYKFYLERLDKGTDSFSIEDLNTILETNQFLEKLYAFSSQYLYKAIESKGNKKYFKMLTYLIPALLSPHIVVHLYNRFKVKSMIKSNHK